MQAEYEQNSMVDQNILSGVKVLDFSRYIAGPYCAALLGYLGADVVRIEKTGGSEDRFVGPMGADGGTVFAQSGGNKRSLGLDLKHARAAEIIERLVARADVVIVNYPPAGLRKLGLDYATLRAIKPEIILTTQTAYGHEGPWAERGGFDGIGQVMSGAAFFTGTPGEPAKSAAPYVDFGTGLYSAFATLAALYQRRDTGEGQHIQASLLGTAMTFFSPLLIEQAVLGANRVPTGNRSQTSAPSDIFATTDGHILLHVVGNGLFRRVCKVLGRDDWIDDPEFQNDEDRGIARDRICDHVALWCGERSSETVIETMAAAGVPCGPVLDPAAALQHPQVKAMGLYKRVPMPGLTDGVEVADFPVAMSGTDAGLRRGPPALGEHAEEILTEVGYGPAEIDELRSAGAI